MPRSIPPALILGVLVAAPIVAETLVNDGWESGDAAAFQGGFATDEIAASRLVPTSPCPCQVSSILVLFGGDAATRNATLLVWDDDGTLAPGQLLLEETVSLTGSSSLQSIDIASRGLVVDGAFRVGLRFTADGLPSIAHDSDGDTLPGRNFVYSGGWFTSEALFIQGDWIFGAVTDNPEGGGESDRLDSWEPGDAAAFQGGLVAGEQIAVRLTPDGPCPCWLEAVRLLFGGDDGTRDIHLYVYQDNGTNAAPGAAIFDAEYQLEDSNLLQRLALPGGRLALPSTFRIGIAVTENSTPSVASDTDGTIDETNNFLLVDGLGWAKSSTLGIDGDWIVRADLVTSVVFFDAFELGNTSAWSSTVP